MAANSEGTAKRRRGKGRPFVKGDPKINRSGRPPLTEAQRTAQQIKHDAQPDAMRRMHAIVLDDTARAPDWIAAARVICEGMEPLKIEHGFTSDDAGLIDFIAKLAPAKPD